MWIHNLLDSLKPWRSRTPVQTTWRQAARRRWAVSRPTVEALEDRCVPASLSISDFAVMEGVAGTQNAALVVSLSEPSTKTVTVNYNTANGTALAGSDYDAVSGKLTFARGETSKSILVPVHGDRLAENDWLTTEASERFIVKLQKANGATIADGTGRVTIVDSSPRLSISSESALDPEGYSSTFMTFTVSLSAEYDETVTVNFTTLAGSASAAAGDYVATSGTLTFEPGELTKTITVEILGDNLSEYDEYFFVTLIEASANVHNGRWGYTDGMGWIYGEFGPPEPSEYI